MSNLSSHPSIELNIADQKSEGKKSRRGKGNEEMQKILVGCEILAPCESCL